MPVPTPRTEVPMEGPTEGELARKRAEEALDAERRRTQEVQAQTPAWVQLGVRIRALHDTNHIRENIQRTMAGRA